MEGRRRTQLQRPLDLKTRPELELRWNVAPANYFIEKAKKLDLKTRPELELRWNVAPANYFIWRGKAKKWPQSYKKKKKNVATIRIL